MNLPYELLIGWRYTRSSRRASRNTFISFISMISMAGIALGVAALIVVISVMNGFQKEVRDRMLAVLSHIEIISDIPVPDWGQVAQYAMKNPAVRGAAPFVAVQAMLTRDDTVRGVILRGVDPGQEGKVSDLSRQFRLGGIAALRPGEFGIALGVELARALDAHVGERVNLLVPQGTMTPAGIMPRLRAFTVTGIFESGHFEYDSALALIHIEDAEKLLRLEGPSGLRLRVADPTIAPRVTRELAPSLGSNFYLRDWSSQNRTWFAAVQTEKRMMFIILTLIIAVAAFNLVSTLVMTVTEKQADIAILRTMGAQDGAILRIFIVQGVSIGVIGTVCGVALGCLVAANIDVIVPAIEALFHVQFLPRDVYFIDELPSDLRSGDVTVIASIAFVMAILATLYPSWRAARVKPAEALRYE
ncbi:MAG: lipoprotein-releasing ABC transporter permease subunit [Candidatus Protistobacter heckmanni]|nr:lipoprotein-releasing ABC transporter permease subunit [Candidatus Protistobacter heckmanni]